MVLCRAELTDTVGLQPALPGMGRTGYDLAETTRAQRLEHAHQSPPAQTLDRAAGQSPMAGLRADGRNPEGAGNSPNSGAAGSSPRPVAEGIEEPHVELSRFSMAASVESCDVYGAPAPMLISRYERNPPPEIVEGKPGQSTHHGNGNSVNSNSSDRNHNNKYATLCSVTYCFSVLPAWCNRFFTCMMP